MATVLGGNAGSHAAITTTIRTRRLVRREHPVWPFLWRGLLPLLGLLGALWYGIRPFAVSEIESTVRSELGSQLAAQGFDWVKVDVSGQHVVLSGTPPAAGAEDGALALARAATCPSWAGRKVCAVSVRGDFGAPEAVPAAAVAACEGTLAQLMSSSTIRFASGSAQILAASSPLLDQLATAIGACPGTLAVEGHTDAIGSPASNRTLSEVRAEAVRRALIARGVPAERLTATGLGPDRPIGDNATAEGRARNRRIEFHVAPKAP